MNNKVDKVDELDWLESDNILSLMWVDTHLKDDPDAMLLNAVKEFERNYGVFASFFKLFLEVEDYRHIVPHELMYETENGDLVEHIDVPDNFVETGYCTDAHVPGFSIGCLQFGSINGIKVISEQNGSPIMIWKKK